MTICLTANDTHDTQSAYMGEYMKGLGRWLGRNHQNMGKQAESPIAISQFTNVQQKY